MPAATVDWAASLAAALVTHGALPPAAKEGLRAAFRRNTEVVIIVLANGEDLEAFDLLRDGLPSEQVSPAHFLGISAPSATLRAIQQQELVFVDANTHDREQLDDWQQLHAAGIDWLLVAPLACGGGGEQRPLTLEVKRRVVGSVLVGGRGGAPSIDSGWLQEWAQEMGCLISHASVQLMEASLEMLGAMFPPKVLEQLILNAARKTGQVDLASALREAMATPAGSNAGGSSTSSQRSVGSTRAGSFSPYTNNTNQTSNRSSLEGRPPLSPSSPASFAPPRQLRSVEMGAGRPPTTGVGDVASPFAEHASLPLAAPRSVAAASDGARKDSSDSLSHPATLLLSQASRGGSAASAILRQVSLSQVSLQSNLSRLFDDQQPVPSSPPNHELEGFEDILEEDHRHTLEHRASMAPERAHSRHQAPGLDQSVAAATAALEEAGGLQAALQQSTAQSVVDSVAAAAAAAAAADAAVPVEPIEAERVEPGSPQQDARSGGKDVAPLPLPDKAPPSIRVPWQGKPVLNPLTGSADEAAACPLHSPCKPSLPKSISSDSLPTSPFSSSPVGAAGEVARQDVDHMLAMTSSSYKSGSSVTSLRTPSSLVSMGSPPPNLISRQAWDLQFIARHLEATYRTWLVPYMLRSDTSLGLVHLAVATFVVGQLAVYGASADTLLSLGGCLLLAAPAVLAMLNPAWWHPRRSAALSVLRLLLTLLLAAHQVLAVERSPGPATWVEAVLGRSGALALCLLAVRQPLPFSLHLPLQLLCLWIITAGASLAHVWREGAAAAVSPSQMPLPIALAAQLLVGFLLSTVLVYRREAHLRASFLMSRHAAVCLSSSLSGSGGSKTQRQPVPPSYTPLAGQ